MQKITPNLWFDTQAEEAAKYYVSVFKDSKMGEVSYYDKAGSEVSGMPERSVLTAEFEIHGMKFVGINGGPMFKFTEAVSFSIECKDQEELDYFTSKLSAHPESEQCGWVKDQFGLSWQIVPSALQKLLKNSDKAAAGRVMQAMLKMKRLNIAELEQAAAGK